MKAYRVLQLSSDDDRWIVQEAEDGGDWKTVEPLYVFRSLAQCRAERDRLDEVENGD